MKLVIKCPVCNSNRLKKVKKYTFRSPRDDIENHLMDYNYVRLWILFHKIMENKKDKIIFNMTLCENCGLLFTNPRFSEEDLRIKYDCIAKLRTNKERSSIAQPEKWKHRAHRVYNLIKKYYIFNLKDQPKILDYGGSAGYILIPFKNDFKCYVIDYEKWDLPEGVYYLGKNLKNTKKFDIILLLHILEHVFNPKKLLEDLSKYLNENGVLIIQIPLECFRLKYLNEPLTHISFFSEESLYNCVKFAGLNIIHLKTSLQKYLDIKNWAIDVVCTKRKEGSFKKIDTILSTKQQMSRFNYHLPFYLPFLFEKENTNLIIIKKRIIELINNLKKSIKKFIKK